jgi:hypothetical protein
MHIIIKPTAIDGEVNDYRLPNILFSADNFYCKKENSIREFGAI